MSDEIHELPEGAVGVPPIWGELYPGVTFNGPTATASMMRGGSRILSMPSGLVTLALVRQLMRPGQTLTVNFHAAGRRGMAEVMQLDETDVPTDAVQGEGPGLARPVVRPVELERVTHSDPAVALAATLDRLVSELLACNTQLVERAMRTADTAINSQTATEASASALGIMTAEAEVLRREVGELHDALELANDAAAQAVQAAQAAQTERAVAVAEAEAEGGGGGGWMDTIIEAVIERMMPDDILGEVGDVLTGDGAGGE